MNTLILRVAAQHVVGDKRLVTMDEAELSRVRELHELAWQNPLVWSVSLEQAVALLRAHLERAPESTVALTNLGACLSDLGLHEDAIAVLERARGLGCLDRNTYFNLAVAMMNTPRRGQATALFKKATTLEALPDTLEAYFDPLGH